MYIKLWSINHTYTRPHNKRKFIKKYYSSPICESIESMIMEFLNELKHKAENSVPLYHRWICNIRLKRFDLLYLFRYIFKPPDTVFRRHT